MATAVVASDVITVPQKPCSLPCLMTSLKCEQRLNLTTVELQLRLLQLLTPIDRTRTQAAAATTTQPRRHHDVALLPGGLARRRRATISANRDRTQHAWNLLHVRTVCSTSVSINVRLADPPAGRRRHNYADSHADCVTKNVTTALSAAQPRRVVSHHRTAADVQQMN